MSPIIIYAAVFLGVAALVGAMAFLMNGSRDALRRQLGVKLFECAQAGERDHVALRQRVLSNMFSSKPGIGVRPKGGPAR